MGVAAVENVTLSSVIELARKEFEEAVWGMMTPGTVNFQRGIMNDTYLDEKVDLMWKLWKIAHKL